MRHNYLKKRHNSWDYIGNQEKGKTKNNVVEQRHRLDENKSREAASNDSAVNPRKNRSRQDKATRCSMMMMMMTMMMMIKIIIARKGGYCDALQLEGRTAAHQSFWAVFGRFCTTNALHKNCHLLASRQNSDNVVGFGFGFASCDYLLPIMIYVLFVSMPYILRK